MPPQSIMRSLLLWGSSWQFNRFSSAQFCRYDMLQCEYTRVSAFVEILLSLQCKIFQYTFLEQYPMEFQDFFSLCQVQQLAWLQIDHRKLGPSKMRLLSDPCIIKLKRRKNTLSCVICCFEKCFWGYLLNLLCIKIAYDIYFIHTNFYNLCSRWN